MSKKSFIEAAGLVSNNGRNASLARIITGISESVDTLEDMVRRNDYIRLSDVVYEMGRHFNKGCRLVQGKESWRELTSAYSYALERLHDVVFEREKDSLGYLVGHMEECRPITQRTDTRPQWDGTEDSWENPAFGRLHGFACLAGRKPPRHLYARTVNVERYAKTSLMAIVDETDMLLRKPLSEACGSLAEFIDTVTQCYERFRTGWYDAQSQFALVFFRAICKAVEVSNRMGTGSCGLMCVRGITTLDYDELFWFRMPEYPSSEEPEGPKRFIVESEREIKTWTNRLCAASVDLFCRWLYQSMSCVETCVAYIAESNRADESRAAALLVLVVTKVRDRLAVPDFEEGLIGKPTIPIGESSGYSLSNAIGVMRTKAKYITNGCRGTRVAVLARRLREITLEFSYALNFEWCKRRQLINEYSECLTIIRKKAIDAI